MKIRRRTDQPSESDLAALADGSLTGARRDRVERAVARSPELQDEIAAQHRVLRAISDAGADRAPASLRAHVAFARGRRRRPRAGLAASAASAATAGRAARAGRAVTAMATAGTLAAAAVVAAVVVLAVGSNGAATVAEASTLAARPAQMKAPAPAPHEEGNALPRLRAAGLPYPYWEDAFGYRAVGVRYDRLDGRAATTVFYVHGGTRVAYTIVSGAPLPAGASTRGTVRDGVSLQTLAAHGSTVVTWSRAGHTCVLSGTGTNVETLLHLASWRHGGEVRY